MSDQTPSIEEMERLRTLRDSLRDEARTAFWSRFSPEMLADADAIDALLSRVEADERRIKALEAENMRLVAAKLIDTHKPALDYLGATSTPSTEERAE